MGNGFCNVDYWKRNLVKDLEKDFYKFPLGKNITCTYSSDIGVRPRAFAYTYSYRCPANKLPVLVYIYGVRLVGCMYMY